MQNKNIHKKRYNIKQKYRLKVFFASVNELLSQISNSAKQE